MQRERGLERFLTFIDAIVAIAVTLLVLPLAELTDDLDAEATLGGLIQDNSRKFSAFFLSFVVIAALWRAHHTVFTRVRRYDRFLVTCSLGWALTIVLLPFPTEVIAHFPSGRSTVALYVGVLLVSSVLMSVLSVHIARTPSLRVPGLSAQEVSPAPSVATTIWMAVALVVGVAVPRVNFFALFLLFLAGPSARWWSRRRGAAPAGPAAPGTR